MRVAMVSEHASPLAVLGGVDAGGQNVHVAALATELAAQGHDVVVHTRRDDPYLRRQVEMAPGVVVDHVNAGPARYVPKDELLPHMEEFAADLRRQWLAEPPDVVHSHFWMSGRASLKAARGLGIPVAHTFHALGVVKRRHQREADTSPPGRIMVERDISRRADRVIATCSDEVFELIRLGGNRRSITVIPCGVDLELFGADVEPAERTPGRPRLLCVGRLVERKGVGDAIAALAQVPDAELLVAGGPDERELGSDPEARRLRALAREHGVADRVRLLGRVERPELPALMRSADAVLCVPWYEPFGIVPLEAMASGVPVVATAVGGMIDSVVNGLTGVHVPPRQPGRLAAALRSLLADPQRAKRLGAAGAARARERYGWPRIAASTLSVYSQLAGAGARRGEGVIA
jgi:D-inositol-3-phosphate glycosyltransferase